MSKIIDKVAKLLELSKHNNSPEEAASAAAMAQKLMFEHKISMSDLDISESKDEVEVINEVITETGNRCTWKAILVGSLARGFGANAYTSEVNGKTLYHVVATKGNVEAIEYLFPYLVNEINKLADLNFKVFGEGHGKNWKNSFRLGAVNTIAKRIKEEYENEMKAVETMVGNAIVLYRDSDKRQKEFYMELRSKMKMHSVNPTINYNGSAYGIGLRAGESISIGGGKAIGGRKNELGQ
jgi:hypothetical protein